MNKKFVAADLRRNKLRRHSKAAVVPTPHHVVDAMEALQMITIADVALLHVATALVVIMTVVVLHHVGTTTMAVIGTARHLVLMAHLEMMATDLLVEVTVMSHTVLRPQDVMTNLTAMATIVAHGEAHPEVTLVATMTRLAATGRQRF